MDVKSPTMGCSRHLAYQAVVATILVLGAYYIQWLYSLRDVFTTGCGGQPIQCHQIMGDNSPPHIQSATETSAKSFGLTSTKRKLQK